MLSTSYPNKILIWGYTAYIRIPHSETRSIFFFHRGGWTGTHPPAAGRQVLSKPMRGWTSQRYLCFYMAFIVGFIVFGWFSYEFILVTEAKRADISSDFHRTDPSEYCSGVTVDDMTAAISAGQIAEAQGGKAGPPPKNCCGRTTICKLGPNVYGFFSIIFHIHGRKKHGGPF